MAKSIFVTSASALAANQSVVSECVAKQGLPTWFTAQIGQKTVAVPTQHLSASIFAVHAREDGGYGLKVSISGTVANGVVVEPQKGNYNFKVGGWVTVYPEGIEGPAGCMTISYEELKGVMSFSEKNADGSKKSLWYDLSSCPRVYLVLALVDEKHYVLDVSGNKVPAGTDANGKPIFALAEHKVLSFPLGKIAGTICGSGTGGSSVISQDDQASADSFLDSLLGAPAPAVTNQPVSARSL